MTDPVEDVIVEFISGLRAEWRLYPDIYAEELAAKVREAAESGRFVRGSHE